MVEGGLRGVWSQNPKEWNVESQIPRNINRIPMVIEENMIPESQSLKCKIPNPMELTGSIPNPKEYKSQNPSPREYLNPKSQRMKWSNPKSQRIKMPNPRSRKIPSPPPFLVWWNRAKMLQHKAKKMCCCHIQSEKKFENLIIFIEK